jgi:hypothetical protein
VRIQGHRRVRQIAGLGYRAHIEQRAEIRLPGKPERRGHAQYRPRLRRHLGEDDKAQFQELREPVREFVITRLAAPPGAPAELER